MQDADEVRPHYEFDYSKAKPNRFAGRLREESMVVVLDPDVAAEFPDETAVNEALRLVMRLARIPKTDRQRLVQS